MQIILRANHRAGQVAFHGAVGPICLLDADILTSSSRRNAILRHCGADTPARCFAREVSGDRCTLQNSRLVAEGGEPPTLASQRLSFYPQSLCDSPEGHADAVFDVIGHLRPYVSSKLQSSDARLMPLGSRGSGLRGRVYEKKRSSFLNRFLVGAEGVEPPTLCL